MLDTRPAALEPGNRTSVPRKVLAVLLILVLPLVLSIVGYDRPALIGDPLFYGYQLKRAGELNGRWWKVGQDPLLGQPYQNEIAKHAGLYEGVDLMLASAWPSHYLDATQAYYFAAYLALAFNGWVAGALAFRFTRSLLWTAVAIVLITWNAATVDRMVYHLHLIKYGWALLAVWAFFDYLKKPDLRRGAWLGVLVALVLQGSFYFGYFLLLALGTWWVGCLIARKLTRAHLAPTCLAGLIFAIGGFALTFPVWTIARSNFFADDYFHRPWIDTWVYGAELWQYFTPQRSPLGLAFIAQVGAKPLVTYSEGWNFPGYTILFAVGSYLFARLRGWKLWPANAPFINLLLGLMGVFVLLSLAGGPSFFLFEVPALSCFRSYGRTGLLALAAGCVAAPLILQGLIAALRPRGLKAAALAAVLALIACDARHALMLPDRALARYRQIGADSFPEWVEWLRRQPGSVQLAAFSPSTPEAPITWWGFDSLRYRLRHGHATLNGCEFRLLEGDLRLVGASYDHMNAAGLRLIVGLGYEALAFDESYLKANPWIASLPWLDWVEQRGGWRIAKAGGAMPPLPKRSLEQLLAAQPEPALLEAADVPPRSWITGQLDLDRDFVVPDNSRVFIDWADSRGRLRGEAVPALAQHVFGPSIPAYRILTPLQPGDYDLVFLDRRHRRLASRPYRVTPGLSDRRGARLPVASGRSP